MDIDTYLLSQTISDIKVFLTSLGCVSTLKPNGLNEIIFILNKDNQFSLSICIDLDFKDIRFDVYKSVVPIYDDNGLLDLHPLVLNEIKAKFKYYESKLNILFGNLD